MNDRPKTPSRRRGPTKKTRERISLAVRMHNYEGKSLGEIAEYFGVHRRQVESWKALYAPIWDAAEEACAKQITEVVRQAAGTDAVLENPDLYLHHAAVADRWTGKRGEPLFPHNGEPTVCSFFETYYRPTCLSDAADSTLKLFAITLKKWRYFTGDPPLKQIDAPLLAKFRDALSKCRGAKPYRRATANTVASKLRQIQAILDKAGPPRPRNRDAAGILENPPWVRPPRCEPKGVRIVTEEELENCYLAACGMTRPRFKKIKPPKFWRALLVVAHATGLRRGTLFRLRWEWVDWHRRVLMIPGDSMKSKRLHIAPLNTVAIEHLHSIRDDRELVLPWPFDKRHFYSCWHQLLDLAGIPREEHFGLHDLRKTLATQLWQTSPQAAQLALGHSSAAVTAGYYVGQTGIVAAAIDNMEVPAAFRQAAPRN